MSPLVWGLGRLRRNGTRGQPPVIASAVIAFAFTGRKCTSACHSKVGLCPIHGRIETGRLTNGQQSRATSLKQRHEGQRRQRGRDNYFEKRKPGIATSSGAIGGRRKAGNLNVHRECSRARLASLHPPQAYANHRQS